ncbi:MAG: glutathione S-transferase [Parvibaculaceae bacterium]|jgi:glutathione S-transferase
MGHVLYSFRRCPYAMRGRMALMVSGVEVELREVVLRNKPAAMLEASPKATVPVLICDDGTIVDESFDVMLWALEQHDPDQWLAPLEEDKAAMLALIAENDGPFKHNLDRYKYATRYEDVDGTEYRTMGVAFLEKLNDRLASRAYLFGERLALADFAIMPFIRQFRVADAAWFDAQDWPHLRRWLAELMTGPLFSAVMAKYAPWTPEDAGVVFSRAALLD